MSRVVRILSVQYVSGSNIHPFLHLMPRHDTYRKPVITWKGERANINFDEFLVEPEVQFKKKSGQATLAILPCLVLHRHSFKALVQGKRLRLITSALLTTPTL